MANKENKCESDYLHLFSRMGQLDVMFVQRNFVAGAVVVAQLEKRSLPISEINGSNPDIFKFYLR